MLWIKDAQLSRALKLCVVAMRASSNSRLIVGWPRRRRVGGAALGLGPVFPRSLAVLVEYATGRAGADLSKPPNACNPLRQWCARAHPTRPVENVWGVMGRVKNRMCEQ